ncbi:MAG: PilZ domain-containing protein [Myxococcota bacterium]|nr:PilZ domain-containing protein [Myxococcota bacterium]
MPSVMSDLDDKAPQTPENSADRRVGNRAPLKLDVNYRQGETYLFSRTSDVSELGIFLVTEHPLPVATFLRLEFRMPDDGEKLLLDGEVVWVDSVGRSHERGMGIRFITPSVQVKKRLSALIRTIAYLE